MLVLWINYDIFKFRLLLSIEDSTYLYTNSLKMQTGKSVAVIHRRTDNIMNKISHNGWHNSALKTRYKELRIPQQNGMHASATEGWVVSSSTRGKTAPLHVKTPMSHALGKDGQLLEYIYNNTLHEVLQVKIK